MELDGPWDLTQHCGYAATIYYNNHVKQSAALAQPLVTRLPVSATAALATRARRAGSMRTAVSGWLPGRWAATSRPWPTSTKAMKLVGGSWIQQCVPGGCRCCWRLWPRTTPSDPDLVGDPTGNAVEQFLKWTYDPARKALALAGAYAGVPPQDRSVIERPWLRRSRPCSSMTLTAVCRRRNRPFRPGRRGVRNRHEHRACPRIAGCPGPLRGCHQRVSSAAARHGGPALRAGERQSG